MTNGEIIEQLENTIELIKQDGKDWLDDRDIPILETCIKSLIALNKIRAEIDQMPSELTADGRRMIRRGNVFRIIDKYKAGWKKYE